MISRRTGRFGIAVYTRHVKPVCVSALKITVDIDFDIAAKNLDSGG
jgi:hypothetical protein